MKKRTMGGLTLAPTLVCLVAMFSGCAHERYAPLSFADRTYISETKTKQVKRLRKTVVGESCDEHIPVLFMQTKIGNTAEATELALKKYRGAVGLANVTVEVRTKDSVLLPTFFYERCIRVSGQPLVPSEKER